MKDQGRAGSGQGEVTAPGPALVFLPCSAGAGRPSPRPRQRAGRPRPGRTELASTTHREVWGWTPVHLAHTLTPEESRAVRGADGFFAVDEAIPDGLIQRLRPVCDRIDREERERQGKGPGERINHFRLHRAGTRSSWSCSTGGKTFPKVWGILGWHIQLYHTHMMVTPPEPAGRSLAEHGLDLGWHQDTGLLNQDLETEPRPRVSLKVGYFLTDTSEEGRGNFYVVPGSHLRNEFPGPDRKTPVDGAVAVPRAAGHGRVLRSPACGTRAAANYWHEARAGPVLRLLVPLAAAARRHDRGALPGPLRSHPQAAARRLLLPEATATPRRSPRTCRCGPGWRSTAPRRPWRLSHETV